MKLALVLLGCLVQAGWGHVRYRGTYWSQPFGFSRGIYTNKETEASIWTSTGTVPDRVLKVPDHPLDIRFGNLKIYTNNTYDVDKLLYPPTQVSWPADPNALYTIMLEDEDIPFFPIKFMSWMVTNIKGNNIATGDITAAWIPPFNIQLNEAEDGLDRTLPEYGGGSHRNAILVFKQKGFISIPEGTSGCDEKLLESRVYDHAKLQEEYDLEGPVAGTFFRSGHSRSGWTEFFICKFTRCTGTPIPVPLPGVNDREECQKLD